MKRATVILFILIGICMFPLKALCQDKEIVKDSDHIALMKRLDSIMTARRLQIAEFDKVVSEENDSIIRTITIYDVIHSNPDPVQIEISNDNDYSHPTPGGYHLSGEDIREMPK